MTVELKFRHDRFGGGGAGLTQRWSENEVVSAPMVGSEAAGVARSQIVLVQFDKAKVSRYKPYRRSYRVPPRLQTKFRHRFSAVSMPLFHFKDRIPRMNSPPQK